MTKKSINPLSLDDGFEPNFPAISQRAAPFYRPIFRLSKRDIFEANLLHPTGDGKTAHTNLESNDNLSKVGRQN